MEFQEERSREPRNAQSRAEQREEGHGRNLRNGLEKEKASKKKRHGGGDERSTYPLRAGA